MNNRPVVITFHKIDFDGQGSASIAREYLLKNGYTEEKIEMYPINHGDDMEKYLESIINKDVIMVDFSLTTDNMEILIKNSNDLIWIDHHITPIKEMQELGLEEEIKGVRTVDFSAIELTWRFFFPNAKIPKIIYNLGVFDSWRDSNKDNWENFVMPVQFAMKGMNTDPMVKEGRDLWSKIINGNYISNNEYYLNALRVGKRAYIKQIKLNKELYSDKFFEKKVFGYNAIVLETPDRGSLLFKDFYFKNKHDIMVRYHKSKNDGKYHLSFYTDKDNIDITEFARGHKKAAGMIVSSLSEVFNEK